MPNPKPRTKIQTSQDHYQDMTTMIKTMIESALDKFYIRGYLDALELIEKCQDMPLNIVLARARQNIEKIKAE